MCEQKCKDCRHFRQHYTLDERKIFQVCCGHCTQGRPRQRQPDARACDQFVSGVSREDAFVTKEYLSKKLLHYMLSLELLPEIENRG